jgi:hypothetical protein
MPKADTHFLNAGRSGRREEAARFRRFLRVLHNFRHVYDPPIIRGSPARVVAPGLT